MSDSVLVIDDDPSVRELLRMHLDERGLRVRVAATARQGEALLEEAQPQAVVLDLQLPDRPGMEFLAALRQYGDAPVVVITGHHEMAMTILAMKAGAFDYLRKPLDLSAFDDALDRALAHRRLSATTPVLGTGEQTPPRALVGRGAPFSRLLKEIGRIAASRATVLLRGESGTGKELVARVIHDFSTPDRPFVAVNCAAIVETLLESELFGHERGAFTGAHAQRPGKCELAADGTLFLDEVGDLSPTLQGKLLRLLQEREFERVGGTRPLRLAARVIAATHRDLPQRVREGQFREDLYQRLNVIALDLPPLRERPEDIEPLVQHLLARINAAVGGRVSRVPPEALAWLRRQPWPGNVRELEHTLTRAVVMAPGDVLLPELLASVAGAPHATLGSAPVAGAPPPSLREAERELIARTLAFTGGNKVQACRLLGISRPTLDRKLKEQEES